MKDNSCLSKITAFCPLFYLQYLQRPQESSFFYLLSIDLVYLIMPVLCISNCSICTVFVQNI